MNCRKCGVPNNDDAKFCRACGAELHQQLDRHHRRRCPFCDFENPKDARFCAHCGAEAQQHHPPSSQHSGKPTQSKKKKGDDDTKLLPKEWISNWRTGMVGIVIIAGTLLLIGSMYLFSPQENRKAPVITEARSSDQGMEIQVTAIASKFICSCGTCGELPLETCECNTAVQERQFIRTSLQSGQSPDQIVLAVNKTFGWMKPQYAAKHDSTTRRNGQSSSTLSARVTGSTKPKLPSENEVGFMKFPQSESGTAKIATTSDLVEIFFHFKCPCGQCGIDELKDCGCTHPRGAKEVKAFVDAKIAERKYTVAQVVNDVELKYGGRKF